MVAELAPTRPLHRSGPRVHRAGRADERTAPVLVVDRPGWIRANADGFATVLRPARREARREEGRRPVAQAVGSRVTGAEVGALLGFLGGKVLGQFDPFFDPAGRRLLLVAPNIVHVERELDADPTDFRLWVCLHEETHRVQFTAVPWMRDHLFGEMQAARRTESSPAACSTTAQAPLRGLRAGATAACSRLFGTPSSGRSSTGSPA